MHETKKWYESKTIWGSIITVAAAAAGFFGYGIDADTQGQIVSNITALIAAAGGILSAIGRLTADKEIA